MKTCNRFHASRNGRRRSGSKRVARSRCLAGALLLGSLLMSVLLIPTSAAAVPCSSLAHLSLPDTTITSAEFVPQGTFVLPATAPVLLPERGARMFRKLPEFCRVTAVIRPVKDSEIDIEVWLPLSGWNDKFLAVGTGGWAGAINYGGLAQSLQKGFATGTTDTGHRGGGGDASFAYGHPEKLKDFGYRAVHLMTLRAKAIIAAFYGNGPRLSYWNGCSTAGYQGLSEAQRFPDDYNGIIAGDPANYFTHLMFGTIWPAETALKQDADYIPIGKYPLIHKAALDACDRLDGVEDGIIDDPPSCHFDPKVLECKGPDAPTCLTADQVESVRKIYEGPKNPRTGEQVFPGLEPGSELGWRAEEGGPQPMAIPLSYFKYVLFKNLDWQWQTLNFDQDVALANRQDGKILDAINPNLEAFKAHGGKLILYHGWEDNLIAPRESINYYTSVVRTMGGVSKTNDFIRLFMIPGMQHCGGGPGTGAFDRVEPIENWVEHGIAPDAIIASHQTGGVVDMTRPLCPYPEVARWKGTGSTKDAANFTCVSPSKEAAK